MGYEIRAKYVPLAEQSKAMISERTKELAEYLAMAFHGYTSNKPLTMDETVAGVAYFASAAARSAGCGCEGVADRMLLGSVSSLLGVKISEAQEFNPEAN